MRMAVDEIAGRTPAVPVERARPKREREEEVLVWPDLVFIEFIAAVLFVLTFIILSVFIDAPLLNRANPDVTPNPSKAPWYFLNLQELLLHMDKAWAGVLVPTIALFFFAAIPYLDRSNDGQGVWFGTKNSGRITVFTAFYSTVVIWLLLLFDAGKFERITRWFPGLVPVEEQRQVETSPGVFETVTESVTKGFLSTKDLAKRWEWSIGKLDWPQDFDHIPLPLNDISWIPWHGMNINLPTTLAEQILPLSVMALLAVLAIVIQWRFGWVKTRRDVFIVMFTGVMAGYLVLSVIGSFFRGQGQELISPLDIKVDPG
jgi:quinol-cytochrome oxidoreductase complex cytochrome b subunit